GVLSVLGEEADSDARRDEELRFEQGEGKLEGLVDPASRGQGAFSGAAVSILRLRAQVGQEDKELVTSLPGYHVAGPDRPAQARSHLPKEFVPGCVSKAVVDQLEVVEVHEQNGHGEVEAASPGQGQVEQLLEHGTVRQAGQFVVVGEEGHL